MELILLLAAVGGGLWVCYQFILIFMEWAAGVSAGQHEETAFVLSVVLLTGWHILYRRVWFRKWLADFPNWLRAIYRWVLTPTIKTGCYAIVTYETVRLFMWSLPAFKYQAPTVLWGIQIPAVLIAGSVALALLIVSAIVTWKFSQNLAYSIERWRWRWRLLVIEHKAVVNARRRVEEAQARKRLKLVV